jgi:hypothetical protein
MNIEQLNELEAKMFKAYTLVTRSYHPGYEDVTKADWREALRRLMAVREAIRRMKEKEINITGGEV